MNFAFPWAFVLFLILPWVVRRPASGRNRSAFYGDLDVVKTLGATRKARLAGPVLRALRTLSLVLLVTALARPRSALESVWQESEGVDILLVVDVSSSMLAEDFSIGKRRYSRLEVVKRVLEDFIAEREQDRIGIVMFAGSAMTVCPLTTDYAVLTRFLERVRTGILPDNTAIGEAVAFSVNRLKKAKGASRVMILLTDGANNAGTIQPLLGAELAAAKRIKVYTIGAGKKGRVPYPVNTVFGRQYDYVEIPIDETLLRRIAKKTGGKYFRATSTEGLREIYREIDKMEKTRVKIARSVEYREMFPFFLVPGILALLIEIVLTNTVFLRIP